MTRRSFVPAVVSAYAAAVALADDSTPIVRKGKLKQCVCSSVFGSKMSFEDRARNASRLGVAGFDLIGPDKWPILKKYNLIPTMVPGGGGTIRDGLNRLENHAQIEKDMRRTLDLCAEAKAPNLITFSGSRGGQPDNQGLDNSLLFLNKVKAQAEDKGVTICIELLNSKVDHKDYQFDHAAWGLELIKRVNSPRVKVLFDMYHAQIMEGDIIRTIRENIQSIGHFHTAGNPGRHEMDDTQEMHYRGIAKAIADLNYSGYIAHEYSPLRDPLTSAEETLSMFDVS